jgi:acetyl-CoA decarbonylase/synthase complex subunit gamma
MRSILELLGEASLLGLGVAGLAGAVAMPAAAAWALLVMGALLAGLHLLSLTFVGPDHPWPTESADPRPMRLTAVDYGKALVSWLLGFHRTYAVEPGLYYLGDHHDPAAPLLVTANYHLTVFLVARRARAAGARLLVIDSDGINVWCAAGKGRFGHEQILAQTSRYPDEVLSDRARPTLILPKFGMPGVDLKVLREARMRPVIGPLYAKDIPAYLAAPPYRDAQHDRVDFGLASRVFVWLPGLLQVTALSTLLAMAIWLATLAWGGTVPLAVVGIAAALATAYPLLYPWIPGHRFAVKGLWLGGLGGGAVLVASALGWLPWTASLVLVPFILATGALIGLEFTGNSAVSNYSRVKREMAAFVPVTAVLYAVSLAAHLVLEVSS